MKFIFVFNLILLSLMGSASCRNYSFVSVPGDSCGSAVISFFCQDFRYPKCRVPYWLQKHKFNINWFSIYRTLIISYMSSAAEYVISKLLLGWISSLNYQQLSAFVCLLKLMIKYGVDLKHNLQSLQKLRYIWNLRIQDLSFNIIIFSTLCLKKSETN